MARCARRLPMRLAGDAATEVQLIFSSPVPPQRHRRRGDVRKPAAGASIGSSRRNFAIELPPPALPGESSAPGRPELSRGAVSSVHDAFVCRLHIIMFSLHMRFSLLVLYSIKLELEKLAQDKSETQRHYVMVSMPASHLSRTGNPPCERAFDRTVMKSCCARY